MTKPEKGYQKFLDTYIELTAPHLNLKYNKDERTLSYLYVNSEKKRMKLVPITDNYEEILYFFDLHWIGDLKKVNDEDFINGILYSAFFNYEVCNWRRLKDKGVPTPLIIAFKKQRNSDSLMKLDSQNYLFINNYHVSMGLVDEVFPKVGLRDKIELLLKDDSVAVEDKMLNYPNAILWCPKIKEQKKSVESVVGICQAHAAWVKDKYNKSHKQYIKDTDLDTIIRNFRNYINDVKFVV